MQALEPVVIEFRGFCSKKNRKAPKPNGRGLYIEPRTRAMLDMMALQVPAEARDLKLEHVDIDWSFTHTNARVDRDGIITTVLDILQQMGTLVNDSIAHCNGTWSVHPSIRGEYDSVTVVLTPHVAPEDDTPVSRYIDPRRKRMRERVGVSTAPALASPLESGEPGEYPTAQPALRSRFDFTGLEDFTEGDHDRWDAVL